MSVELVVGLVGAVCIPVTLMIWQIRRGEQMKKSLPPLIEVTYLALMTVVAERKSASATSGGLGYNAIYEQIVDSWNKRTEGGNFNPDGRNRSLHRYVKQAVKDLSEPKSQTLGSLIEVRDSGYTVTPQGEKIFEGLPDDSSQRGQQLHELLVGAASPAPALPSAAAGQSSSASARQPGTRKPLRPTTPAEWRYAVYMAMPEDKRLPRDELVTLLEGTLSLGTSVRTVSRKKVDRSITWNLNHGNLSQDDAGRIGLVAQKTGKTPEDFK